jgi:BirA family biotin operon repressor/biotin-[acetyl-CoA-carboxylase] ligase
MVGNRKVCGTLTEVLHAETQPATIVGVGLNVNLALDTPGLPPTATSLAFERGAQVDREAVFHAIILEIDARLTMSDGDLHNAIRTDWQDLLWRRQQVVRINDDETTLEGTVLGLTETGALRIVTAEGRTVEVSVGELVIDA